MYHWSYNLHLVSKCSMPLDINLHFSHGSYPKSQSHLARRHNYETYSEQANAQLLRSLVTIHAPVLNCLYNTASDWWMPSRKTAGSRTPPWCNISQGVRCVSFHKHTFAQQACMGSGQQASLALEDNRDAMTFAAFFMRSEPLRTSGKTSGLLIVCKKQEYI